MSDFYQNTVNKFRGSPASVVLFIAALTMLVIGINHFVEDTYSSYFGLLNLESKYNLNVQIFDWSYWTMSLAPQIASIVFFYLYLADKGNKWLALSAAAQLMDFFADAWYRGNGLLLENLGVFTISSALTFIYFSVGSEVFISVGGGLVLKMLAPALSAWKIEMKNIGAASKGEYHKEQQGEKADQRSVHKGGGHERREKLESKYRHQGGGQSAAYPSSTQPRQQMGFQTRDLNKHPLSEEELQAKIHKLGYKSTEDK